MVGGGGGDIFAQQGATKMISCSVVAHTHTHIHDTRSDRAIVGKIIIIYERVKM